MSAENYTYMEQDPIVPPAGNELPTYDDLAQQNGPNSRYIPYSKTHCLRIS